MSTKNKIACFRCEIVPEMIIKKTRMWVQDGFNAYPITRRNLCKKCFDELYEESVQYMISLREK